MDKKNRISELRKEKGISQLELGGIVGAAQNTICNWENGNRDPDYEMLKKLAKYFDVTTDYLLRRTNRRSYKVDWHESKYEDFENARRKGDVDTQQRIFKAFGVPDDLRPVYKSLNKEKTTPVALDFTPDEQDLIACYRLASLDDRSIVDLTLKKYRTTPRESGESLG